MTKIKLDKTLLVVVDLQNGFVNDGSQHVVKPVVRFIEDWKARGGHVLATRFINDPGSQWERLIHWSRLRTEPETSLVDEIDTSGCRVVEKRTYTSLTPKVLDVIADGGYETLLLIGIATDGCVLKTAVDAFEQGLTPIVLSDLCASHAGNQVHEAGLLLIGRFIGKDQIISSKELLERLSN